MERQTPDHPAMISFQAPADLAKELRQMARRNSRSVSGELRHLIKQAVNHNKQHHAEMPQAA